MRKETLKTKRRTLNEPVRPLPTERIELALRQGYGAPCRPVVEIDQRVSAGDLVARSEPESGMQLRIHASIAGLVTQIAPRPAPGGLMEDAIVIESDGSQEQVTIPVLDDETPETICDVVKEAGIIGLGGALFPTYLKLSLSPDDEVDSAIINGCECEAYLTGDYRVLIEQSEDVADGLNLIRQATCAEHGYIVTGADMRETTRNIEGLLNSGNGNQVVHLEHEGVIGYEKILIRATLGREVPFRKLPKDVAVVVQNVQTAAAISRAVRQGIPLTERVITVSGGAVARPGNYRVPIGAPLEKILEACEWEPKLTSAVIMGGPMMGMAVDDVQTATRKGTGGVLALTPEEVQQLEEATCIRCGSCASTCPLGLVPVSIARLNSASPAALESLWADYCVECGECEYACPSGQPLLEKMRAAKRVVMEAREAKL